MASVSDEIEAYLQRKLDEAPLGFVEIQRAQLAERFDCVPSQITYVLMTRFSRERGYEVQARRGGGGGIRLMRLNIGSRELWSVLARAIAVDQAQAEGWIQQALMVGCISPREARMMQAVVRREVLKYGLPERDELRARLLRAMFAAAFQPEGV